MRVPKYGLFLAVVFVALVSTAQLGAQSVPVTLVKAGRLLNPRTGNVLTPAAVLIEGDKIKQVGSASQMGVPTGAKIIDLGNATLLPGLIDSHTHLLMDIVLQTEAERARHLNGGYAPAQLLAIVESPSKRVSLGAQMAREDLESGVSVAERHPTPPQEGAVKVNAKDGVTYVWIGAGTFTMGCSPGDNECFDDEKPAHTVTISKGFWIGQTLVTQAAYRRVIGAGPSRFKGEQLPVETVSWNEAQGYCRRVGMRLPTEAEWEYAARAGSTGPRYGDLEAIAWYSGNSGPQPIDGSALFRSDPKNYENNLIAAGNQTHIVGRKQPNAWKLYDMLGNVWEWTADWFDKEYYTHSETRDPTGPSNGTYRALGGGAWDDDARNTRVSNRYWLAPDTRAFYTGFRCVGETLP
jgi:formylglycine-generating enzyme